MDILTLIMDFLNPILNNWGYLIVFFSAILESSPLVGTIIPGQTIVILCGFFAKFGDLSIYGIIILASLGAIMGDSIAYYIGNKYGVSFIEKYGKYFFLNKNNFEKTKNAMLDNTGYALIVGRFHSITRALTPFAAGVTNIKFYKFIIYDIIGGICWSATFSLVGYISGASLETAVKFIGRFILIGTLASFLLIYVYRFINKQKHIFAKYHLYLLITSITSIYIFSKMIEDFIDNESTIKIDFWLNQNITNLWHFTWLNNLFKFITELGSIPVVVAGIIILFIIFIKNKKWYFAILLFASMSIGEGVVLIVKNLTERLRPINSLIPETGFSFPSAHATISTIFFLILAYYLKHNIKNEIFKKVSVILCIIMFILIGFSRIYLNVHWFSDVIAGFSLGIMTISLLILLFRFIVYLKKEKLYFLRNKLDAYIDSLK